VENPYRSTFSNFWSSSLKSCLQALAHVITVIEIFVEDVLVLIVIKTSRFEWMCKCPTIGVCPQQWSWHPLHWQDLDVWLSPFGLKVLRLKHNWQQHQSSSFLSPKLSLQHSSRVTCNHCDMTLMWQTCRDRMIKNFANPASMLRAIGNWHWAVSATCYKHK